MNQIKCGILHIEGEPMESIEGFIKQTPFLTLSIKSTSPAEMLAACYQKEIQLLYCGIGTNIKKVASFCSFIEPDILIVFVSTDPNQAFECFRLNALDFFLSTDSYYIFLESANKAFRYFSYQETFVHPASPNDVPYIYIKSEYKVIRVELEFIDYIESYGDYIRIYCSNRSKPIMSLCSLRKIEDILPTHEFIRVHRSYIVRKKSISMLENGCIVFDKVRIPVGKSYQKNFQEYINHLPII